MIKYLFMLLTLFLSILGFAGNIDGNQLLVNNKINRHYIAGTYPAFKDKKFHSVNRSIKRFIYKELNSEMGKIEVGYDLLLHNNRWASFDVYYNVSNLTEQYFVRYYTVDLNNGKQIFLMDYLKRKGIQQSGVNQAINDFIKPCYDENKPDYCSDVPLDTLLSSNDGTLLDIKDHSSFYIKDDQTIIIAFDSYKFTVPFSFNIDTNTIGTNY